VYCDLELLPDPLTGATGHSLVATPTPTPCLLPLLPEASTTGGVERIPTATRAAPPHRAPPGRVWWRLLHDTIGMEALHGSLQEWGSEEGGAYLI
jgi:hypothetical protein